GGVVDLEAGRGSGGRAGTGGGAGSQGGDQQGEQGVVVFHGRLDGADRGSVPDEFNAVPIDFPLDATRILASLRIRIGTGVLTGVPSARGTGPIDAGGRSATYARSPAGGRPACSRTEPSPAATAATSSSSRAASSDSSPRRASP